MNSDEEPAAVLSRSEAWALLQGSRFGRLAVSVSNQPDIFPLNFVATNESIWIRTNPGTKLAELTINASVALESDEVRMGKPGASSLKELPGWLNPRQRLTPRICSTWRRGAKH